MTLMELLSLGRIMALAETQASGMEQPRQVAAQETSREDVMAVEMERGQERKDATTALVLSPTVREWCVRHGGKHAMLVEDKDILLNVVNLNGHKTASETDMKCIVYTPVEAAALHLRQQVPQSEEYVYTVTRPKTNLLHAKIKVSYCNIQVMLDSQATVNIIDEATYQRLRHKPSLTKCTVPFFPCGSSTSLVESKSRVTNATFQVLQGSNGSLLGYDTASQLGLIKVANSLHTSPEQPVQPMTTSNQTEMNATGDLLTEYADLFHGIGKLKEFREIGRAHV